jgi:hypothetical protein
MQEVTVRVRTNVQSVGQDGKLQKVKGSQGFEFDVFTGIVTGVGEGSYPWHKVTIIEDKAEILFKRY